MSTHREPTQARSEGTILMARLFCRLPAPAFSSHFDHLADPSGRVTPIRLHCRLCRIRLTVADGINDRVMLGD